MKLSKSLIEYRKFRMIRTHGTSFWFVRSLSVRVLTLRYSAASFVLRSFDLTCTDSISIPLMRNLKNEPLVGSVARSGILSRQKIRKSFYDSLIKKKTSQPLFNFWLSAIVPEDFLLFLACRKIRIDYLGFQIGRSAAFVSLWLL